jgi:hypothetical protein
MHVINSNPNRQNKTNEYFEVKRKKNKKLNENKKNISKQILNRWEQVVEYDNCNQDNGKEFSISNPASTSYVPASTSYVPASNRPYRWTNGLDYEDYEDY